MTTCLFECASDQVDFKPPYFLVEIYAATDIAKAATKPTTASTLAEPLHSFNARSIVIPYPPETME